MRAFKKKKKGSIIIIIAAAAVIILYSFAAGRINELVDVFTYKAVKSEKTVHYEGSAKDSMTTVFIDVGQGDCILIMCGKTNILIDAGDASYGSHVLNRLEFYNIDHLDYLINTHPHSDHTGGMDYVLKEIEVDMVLLSASLHNTYQYNQVLDVIKDKEIPVKVPDVLDEFITDDIKMTFYSPKFGEDFENVNDYSLVCVIESDFGSVYLGGDVELSGEMMMLQGDFMLPDVDIYKVSHHGSASSNLKELIEQLNPEYAVISCGRDNDYNHPDDKIIQMLNQLNIMIIRTDTDGEILIVQDMENISVYTRKQ